MLLRVVWLNAMRCGIKDKLKAMKSYALVLGVLILALVVWRIASNRRSVEPDIDVMMDRHADDAVKEANTK